MNNEFDWTPRKGGWECTIGDTYFFAHTYVFTEVANPKPCHIIVYRPGDRLGEHYAAATWEEVEQEVRNGK